MQAFFVGANLRLARVFCGYTLEELGERVGKTRQFIHKLETNSDRPTEALAAQLADCLDVLPEFFFGATGQEIVEHQVHFRKLRTTKVAAKQKAIAKAEVFKRLLAYCEARVRLPEYAIIERNVSGLEEIERTAEAVRSHFGLGLGPIQNMTRLVENAGTPVTTFRGVSASVDALSIASTRPFIVRNEEDRFACRVRFDIAHEMGHLVMHAGLATGDRQTESEANRFAGAFLLPRSSFPKEFPVSSTGRISWKSMTEVKLRWKVSKAAMVMRARQLHLIDDHQMKGAFIYLKNSKQAKKESEDDLIEIERPVLLDKAVRFITRHYGISLQDVARSLHVKLPYITEFLSEDTLDELRRPSNITRLPALRSA